MKIFFPLLINIILFGRIVTHFNAHFVNFVLENMEYDSFFKTKNILTECYSLKFFL